MCSSRLAFRAAISRAFADAGHHLVWSAGMGKLKMPAVGARNAATLLTRNVAWYGRAAAGLDLLVWQPPHKGQRLPKLLRVVEKDRY